MSCWDKWIIDQASDVPSIRWENDYLEQQTCHFIPLIPALLWPKLGTDVNSILKCVSYGFGLTRPDWNKKKRILVYHHQVVYFLSGAKLGTYLNLLWPSLCTLSTIHGYWDDLDFYGSCNFRKITKYGLPNVCFKSNQLFCLYWFIHNKNMDVHFAYYFPNLEPQSLNSRIVK